MYFRLSVGITPFLKLLDKYGKANNNKYNNNNEGTFHWQRKHYTLKMTVKIFNIYCKYIWAYWLSCLCRRITYKIFKIHFKIKHNKPEKPTYLFQKFFDYRQYDLLASVFIFFIIKKTKQTIIIHIHLYLIIGINLINYVNHLLYH